jgi:transcription-repair coupling factor (superfamily II helicase)
LYLRLLNNAVEEIKSGSPSTILSDISIDLPIEARIPQSFESDKQKRIELYHKWALINDIDELSQAKDELQKEGAIPKIIENLFFIFKLKILGRRSGITSIDTSFESISSQDQIIILKTSNPIDPKIFSKMLDVCDKWQYSQEGLKILKKDLGQDWMKKLEQCLKQL